MKKTLLINCSIVLLAAISSFSAHAENEKLDRSCQSLGKVNGNMVYLSLYKTTNKTKTSYKAVFKKDSDRKAFLTVDGIERGKNKFSGSSALTNIKAGFEFTSDSEKPSYTYEASFVDFIYNGKKQHIALSCNHNIQR